MIRAGFEVHRPFGDFAGDVLGLVTLDELPANLAELEFLRGWIELLVRHGFVLGNQALADTVQLGLVAPVLPVVLGGLGLDVGLAVGKKLFDVNRLSGEGRFRCVAEAILQRRALAGGLGHHRLELAEIPAKLAKLLPVLILIGHRNVELRVILFHHATVHFELLFHLGDAVAVRLTKFLEMFCLKLLQLRFESLDRRGEIMVLDDLVTQGGRFGVLAAIFVDRSKRGFVLRLAVIAHELIFLGKRQSLDAAGGAGDGLGVGKGVDRPDAFLVRLVVGFVAAAEEVGILPERLHAEIAVGKTGNTSKLARSGLADPAGLRHQPSPTLSVIFRGLVTLGHEEIDRLALGVDGITPPAAVIAISIVRQLRRVAQCGHLPWLLEVVRREIAIEITMLPQRNITFDE